MSYRKCHFSPTCNYPAEFILYPEIPEEAEDIPLVHEMAKTLESQLCAGHLRIQLKKDHDQGIFLSIDRL